MSIEYHGFQTIKSHYTFKENLPLNYVITLEEIQVPHLTGLFMLSEITCHSFSTSPCKLLFIYLKGTESLAYFPQIHNKYFHTILC